MLPFNLMGCNIQVSNFKQEILNSSLVAIDGNFPFEATIDIVNFAYANRIPGNTFSFFFFLFFFFYHRLIGILQCFIHVGCYIIRTGSHIQYILKTVIRKNRVEISFTFFFSFMFFFIVLYEPTSVPLSTKVIEGGVFNKISYITPAERELEAMCLALGHKPDLLQANGEISNAFMKIFACKPSSQKTFVQGQRV